MSQDSGGTLRSVVKYFTERSLFFPLAGLWLLTMLLVSPIGNFPLNDDWVYYRGVESILEDGSYDPHPFSASLFVAQAYWGALFAWLFGLSFTTLRFSTLLLALIGAWATANGARRCGAARFESLLAGGVLLASPLCLNLSYTFMTDVPFMAVVALSVLFYIIGWDMLPKKDGRFVLLATIVACVAFFIRQFGILVPLSFFMVYILYCAWHRGQYRWYYSFSLFVPWFLVFPMSFSYRVVSSEAGQTADWNSMGNGFFDTLTNGGHWMVIASCYLMLFAVPFIPGLMATGADILHKGERWRWRVIAALTLAITLLLFTSHPYSMPFLSNVLYDLGVGPLTLSGQWENGTLYRAVSLGTWWWIPTVLGLVGVLFALFRALYTIWKLRQLRYRGDFHDYREVFLILTTVLFIAAVFNPWLQLRFDRYLLPALPTLAILCAKWMSEYRSTKVRIASATLFLLLYGASIIFLQDYMAWNRARWSALERLQEIQGVPPEEIDGGYEFNGLYTSQSYIDKSGREAFAQQGPIGHWVVKDTYAIGYQPREDFESIGTVPYYSWLGFKERNIHVLHRIRESERFPR